MKVFVSYSRTDVDFADQLIVWLNDRGFDTILDRHDIDAAEKWKDRLASLIFSCDTVVFILSDRSAASDTCAWEVEEAERQNKRLIPVVPRLRQETAAPAALRNLNYIHFYADPAIPGSGMFDGALKLDRALRIDLDWLRRQTRYAEQAALWSSSRIDDQLLRGTVLEEALAWRLDKPGDAAISADISAFIDASADAEDRRRAVALSELEQREAALETARAAVSRVRKATYIGAGATLVAGMLALSMGWLAVKAIASSSKKNAALFARQAQDIMAETGDRNRALLMVLYGDPASIEGTWDPIIAKVTPFDGYEPAMAVLVAAITGEEVRELSPADVPMDGENWISSRSDAGGSGPDRRAGATVSVRSVDGSLILTGHADGSARLWYAAGGTALAVVPGGGGPAGDVAISRDSRQLAVTSADGATRLWETPSVALVSPEDQVRIACEYLRNQGAPEAFRLDEAEIYPILAGEPPDPDRPGYFINPCAPLDRT